VAVVYADREFVPPALRAFIDAAVAWAAADPTLAPKLPPCEQHAKRVSSRGSFTRASRCVD
jgi:hypothetical protein